MGLIPPKSFQLALQDVGITFQYKLIYKPRSQHCSLSPVCDTLMPIG